MSGMDPRIRAALAGVGIGLVLVIFLPASWLFTGGLAMKVEHGEGTQFACPMFCVVMDELPGDGRCPVCGMELDEVSGELKLNRAEQRMAGIEAVRLERVPLVRTVRVVGEVDYDERLVSRVTTRAAGWLTNVFVDAGWEDVEKDAPLVSIYSPELFAAQEEFLVARAAKDGPLLAAARRRLTLLGVGEAEIGELERTEKTAESLVLRSPRSGVVVTRNALPGASVKRGETLFAVADLGRVWIQTEVYERDLPLVRVGHSVRLDAETLGRTLVGRVAFIDPAIERRTRTARVRVEVENPRRDDGTRLLRIGQRVDAVIEARLDGNGEVVAPGGEPAKDPLALPASAVLRTGERTIAYALFTEKVPGKPVHRLDPDRLPETVLYQLTPIRVGPAARRAGTGDDYYAILDAGGLPEGAVFVSKGNLLLDSQAQLSGKPSLLFPEGNRGGGGPHEGH
jgi:Cu(I)/Ag(I) efflux system membrane fusion protein